MCFGVFYLVADSGYLVLGYVSLLYGKDVAGQKESLNDMQWEAAYVPSCDDSGVPFGRCTDRELSGIDDSVFGNGKDTSPCYSTSSFSCSCSFFDVMAIDDARVIMGSRAQRTVRE